MRPRRRLQPRSPRQPRHPRPAASASPPAPATSERPPRRQPSTPAPVESAALDPVALPPAANDGSTRYGIEIGIGRQAGRLAAAVARIPHQSCRPRRRAPAAARACARQEMASDRRTVLERRRGVAGLRPVQESVAALRGDGLRGRRALITRRGTAGPSRGRREAALPGPALTSCPATST